MYDARTRKSPLKSECYEQDWCSEEPLAEHRTCCLLYVAVKYRGWWRLIMGGTCLEAIPTLNRTFSNTQHKVWSWSQTGGPHAGALLTPLSPKVGLIHGKLWLNSNRYSTFSNAISWGTSDHTNAGTIIRYIEYVRNTPKSSTYLHTYVAGPLQIATIPQIWKKGSREMLSIQWMASSQGYRNVVNWLDCVSPLIIYVVNNWP